MKLLYIETKKKEVSEKEIQFLKDVFKKHLDIELDVYHQVGYDLSKLSIEDGSIVQSSLEFSGKYDWVNLKLTDSEWKTMKLWQRLWGEHQKVKGVDITFSRYKKGTRRVPKEIALEMPGITDHLLTLIHEFIHSAEGKMSIAHSFLYGYDRVYTYANEQKVKPKRYVNTPSLLKALQWVLLNSKLQKLLIRYKAMLQGKMDVWSRVKWFKQSEFDHPEKMQDRLILAIDKLREELGFPLKINSDYRTTGSHVSGVDIDFEVNGGLFYKTLDKIYSSGKGSEMWTIVNRMVNDKKTQDLLKNDKQFLVTKEAINQGFTRIGIYNSHIHIGMKSKFPQKVVWVALSR